MKILSSFTYVAPLLFMAGLLTGAMMVKAEPVIYVKPLETARLKPGTNSTKAVGHCSMCHSADYISTQPPLSRTTWKAIVVKMQKVHGAPIPEAEVEPIVDYLAKMYGTEKVEEAKRAPVK